MGISLFMIVFGLVWMMESFYIWKVFSLIPSLQKVPKGIILGALLLLGAIVFSIGFLSWMGVLHNALVYEPKSNYTLGLTIILIGMSTIVFSKTYAKWMRKRATKSAVIKAMDETGLQVISIGGSILLITIGIIFLLGI